MYRVLPLFLLAACADLPAIADGMCGNQVLDDSEDCDGFVDESLGARLRCADDALRGCRYVCGGNDLCPTGWSCGADAICRPPGGSFRAGAAVAVPRQSIELADFDGDGRLDLLGDDRLRFGVAYGSGGGNFAAPARLDSRRGLRAPVVADLDADARKDVVLDDGQEQYVWLGRENRQLEPTLHVAARVPTAGEAEIVPMRWAPEGEMALVEIHRALDTRVALGGADPVVLPDGPFVGEPLLIDLDPDLLGEELVLAVGRRLYVLGREQIGEGRNQHVGPLAVHAVVEVDEPLRRGVAAADVDGDGHVDLLSAVAGRWGEQVVVAYGDGQLGFRDRFGNPGRAMIDERMQSLGPVERPQVSDPRRVPLAALHLGTEPRDALVSEAGVFVWSFDSLLRVEALVEGIHLSDAVVADFNRDGFDDLAVSQVDARGIQLLLARADGSLSALLFDTAGVPTRLLPGYFDGDLLDDLVFAERSPLPGARERVAVMYSGSPGKLLPAVSLGEVDDVLGLTQGALAGGSGMDLLVVSRHPDAPGELELAIIEDSPERRLGSPLRLGPGLFGLGELRVAVGQLLGDSAHDLAMLAYHVVWLVPGRGDGSFAETEMQEIFLPDILPAEAQGGCPLVSSSDFIQGGGDEVLVVTGGPCPPGWDGTVVSTLVLVEDGTKAEVHPLPDGIRRVREITPVDLDGDGDPEQVLHVDRYQPAGSSSETQRLYVLDFHPGLGISATPLPLPAPPSGAFAALNLDREPGVELVVSSAPLQTFLLDRDASGDWQVAGTLDVPPAAQLRAGDLDGDELTDLVVLRADSLFPVPYLAQPQLLPGPAGR